MGRSKIYRTESSAHFYALEEEVRKSVVSAADELKNLISPELPDEDRRAYAIGEVLFSTLDSFGRDSFAAAVVFLRYYGWKVSDPSSDK